MPIKVLIADDHEFFRLGIAITLKKHKDIQLVGEVSNGKELLSSVEKLHPDVVITDIKMPVMDGFEATRIIATRFPKIPIIALTMFDEEQTIMEMLEAGAKGYLMKNAESGEIIEAISAVSKEIPYYCRYTSTKLARMIAQSKYNPYRKSEESVFADKELDVIKLICEGYTTKEIAEQLFYSVRTIEIYKERICKKMNVKNTAGIIIYAIKNKLYKVE